jgi:AbiV family abortive infection protein
MSDLPGKSPGDKGLGQIEAAIKYGGAIYSTTSSRDFDAAFDHILELLNAATLLYTNGYFSTAAFVAITAIEEAGKAHVAIFRKDAEGPKSKGQDPLRNHGAKHAMAVLPTVFFDMRLVHTLGRKACVRLQAEAENGEFVKTREAALYCGRMDGSFVTPQEAVSKARAWELVLLAIATLDDALIGYTNHTNSRGEELGVLFDTVAKPRPHDAEPIKEGTFACLGWGSLIWDQQELHVGGWSEDGPMLPVAVRARIEQATHYPSRHGRWPKEPSPLGRSGRELSR